MLSTACVWVGCGVFAAPPVAASTTTGTADRLIGQPNFTTGYPAACPAPPTAASLCQPMQSAVDASGNVWVVDHGDSRVLMFPSGSSTPTKVLGTDGSFTTGEPPPTAYPGPGDSCNIQGRPAGADTLCLPEGVAVSASGTLYVADTYNNRVLVYFNAASKTGNAPADLVLGQPDFASAAANDVVGGGACPARTNLAATQCTLNEPESVSLDASGDLIVADTFNNRVLEWSAATLAGFAPGSCAVRCFIPATHVWGQYGSFESANPNNPNVPAGSACPAPARTSPCTLFMPSDAVVDAGHLIVADYTNNRLLDFPFATPSAQAATAVYGQPDAFANSSNRSAATPTNTTLWNPSRLAVDKAGDLWVADTLNSRVIEYGNPGQSTSAGAVLGQPGYTTNDLNGGGVSARSLAAPAGVSVDPSGNVWVTDSDNNRVLEFNGTAIPVDQPPNDPAPFAPAARTHASLLMVRPGDLAALQAKAAGNDPTWTSVKSVADANAAYTIYPYIHRDRVGEPDSTLFYDYQAENWLRVTMSLGLASLVQPDNSGYARALIDLADEMLAAQIRPQNVFPSGINPIAPDNYYATRNAGPAIGAIYSWMYDTLGATRRARMRALMDAWFNDLASNGYEVNDRADGNYMFGHALAAAFMGYATLGEDASAQEMVDFARVRFDGTPPSSPTFPSAYLPANNLGQVFDGGYTSQAALNAQSNGSPTDGMLGAPFRSGFDFQSWAYGSGTFERMIDYMVLVRAAGGPDFTAQGGAATDHWRWLDAILHGLKAAMLPNNFEIDPTGDWGGNVGAVIQAGLPVRLASVLAGKADGPQAEHFYYSEIAQSSFPDVGNPQPAPWEDFLYGDPSRPSTPMATPLYYSGFSDSYPQGASLPPDHGMPYFLMRSATTTGATWASFGAGTAYYDDHQHYDAGTIFIQRGNDPLLVSATDWKCDGPAFCNEGIVGSSSELNQGSQANTLWFDDFGDAQCTDEQYSGGQAGIGKDQIVAAEQSDAHTYVRTDLSSAYWSPCQLTTGSVSELDHFYRSFAYVPQANAFVVYDEVKARAKAGSSRGAPAAYPKHLRWHLPQPPTVNGSSAHVVNGSSGLWIDALAPAAPSLTAVDERSNPDGCVGGSAPCIPCDGTADGVTNNCTPYGDDSAYTYRLEERYPGNPLEQSFVTVFVPGDQAAANPNVTRIGTTDGKMTGAAIGSPGGTETEVLFNAGTGQTPVPIASTSLSAPPGPATVVLAGMIPGATYSVTTVGSAVTVARTPGAAAVATPAGVLTLLLGGSGGGTSTTSTTTSSASTTSTVTTSTGTTSTSATTTGATTSETTSTTAAGTSSLPSTGTDSTTTVTTDATTTADATTTTVASSSSSTTTGVTAHPPRCRVPKLAHLTLSQAVRALRRAHCRLGRVHRAKHRRGRLHVTSQSAGAQRSRPGGFRINLTLG